MASEPENDKSDHNRWHHHGTVSLDGMALSDDILGGIDSSASLYPYSAFEPNFDDIGFGHPAHTHTEAAAPPQLSFQGASTVAPDPSPTLSFAAAGGDATISTGGTNSGSADQIIQTSSSASSGFVIKIVLDSSITNEATINSTIYNGITNAISAAVNFYETKFTNSETVTIDFGYGEVDGEALTGTTDISSSSPIDALPVKYTTLRADLETHDTALGASALPTSDPLAGGGSAWSVTNAEAKAIGISPNPFTTTVDGYVGLSSGVVFNYATTVAGRAVAGEYDAVGALEHEIAEVMGRQVEYNSGGNWEPLDLFRYSSAGTLATSGTVSSAYFSINNGTSNLAAFNTNSSLDFGDWASSVSDDAYDASASKGVANTVSANDLLEMEMLGYTLACYAAGTRILTARGDVFVEDLRVGDVVRARFAGWTPIRWTGQRRIDCRRHPDPREVLPIRVSAGAFGPDRPHRDLLLSPDHAVAVDGALIPIRLLMNGASIRQETAMAEVHYFHFELDRHDLLLANGLEAESYLDTGNRGIFTNSGSPIVLHPVLGISPQEQRVAQSCLPLRDAPSDVEPTWRALAARAEALGFALPVVETTSDPELHIADAAERFLPVRRDGDRYIFELPALPAGARLRSRRTAPSDLRPWVEDRRHLGVMVHRLVFRRGGAAVEMPLDDAGLADGWWALERDTATAWRWTDGDAALPPMSDPAIVEVVIGNTLRYPVEATEPRAVRAA